MGRTIKLCDISDFYGFHTGGIATFINNKARMFNHLRLPIDHRVIFPSKYDGLHQMYGSTYTSIKSINVNLLAPNYFLHTNFSKLFSLLDQMKPDIIEINSTTTMSVAAISYARKKHIPLISVYHTDLASSFLFMLKWPKLAKMVTKIFVSRLYNSCDVTVVTSKTFKEQLNSLNVRSLELIPLGVNKKIFYPRRCLNAITSILPKEIKRPIGVYAGRLSPDKNVHRLLRAMENSSDGSTFLIAGDGKLKERAYEISKKKGNIYCLGFIDDQNTLAELYSFCDFYITACTSETYGLSLMEAQSCGLPIICVESPILRENLDPFATAFVASPEGLKVAIENFKPKKSANINALDWEDVFKRFFGLYRRILGENNGEFFEQSTDDKLTVQGI